jgi:hypothetical protein
MMAAAMHPAAANAHPAMFITAPGEGDTLLLAVGIILLFSILGIGLLFLRLHTLPERIAHKRRKLQFEIVAVLGLLALLTHVHAFWVAGLLLALIELPDFKGGFNRLAGSLDAIAANTATERGSTPPRADPKLTTKEELHDA